MTESSEEIFRSLLDQYNKLLPLFNYLKTRLKYDTVRWIRTYATKDDVVFTIRIKTFERVYDKLVRKGVTLSKNTNLLSIILGDKGILDDLVGIRFICFDSFSIYRLVSYFLITERVITSQREFYVSYRAKQDTPVLRFLQSNGFSPVRKQDREYEDINFIIRFSHPIDQYFQSGLEKFESLAQRAGQEAEKNETLSKVEALFEQMKSENTSLIPVIPKFPIECQIVTATQHLYNRAQRPHFEYVVQQKEGDPSLAGVELWELVNQLDILKLNLLAIDHAVFSIHRSFGIQNQAPQQINPGRMFDLKSRLPKDILDVGDQVAGINLALGSSIIEPHVTTVKRQRELTKIFELVEIINAKIQKRAAGHGDIAPYDVLQIADPNELSHPEIVFWCYQRIVILTFCMLLLYAPDPVITKVIVSRLRFASKLGTSPDGEHSLEDLNVVIGRLFEKLEHIDNAIRMKSTRKIADWKDDYYEPSIFHDPLIQWRYASHMYSRREYANALQEMKVGMAVYAQLDRLKAEGFAVKFQVPEYALFIRRRLEYELCLDVANLRPSTDAMARIRELCNSVRSRYTSWKGDLEEVYRTATDVAEQARALCLMILFKLCVVASSGMEGAALETIRREFDARFQAIDSKALHNGSDVIRNRSWWLLAQAVMLRGDNAPLLEQTYKSIQETRHHPLERKQFEEACVKILELWESPPAKSRGKTRRS